MVKKKFIILLCAVFSVFLIYISFINPVDDPVPLENNSSFNRLSESLFKSMLPKDQFSIHYYLDSPQSYGIDNIETSVGRFNYNDMQNNNSYYINLLSALKKIDYSALSTEEKITYDSLVIFFRNELDSSDYLLNYEILTPTTGIQSQLPILLNQYTLKNAKDVDDYLTIISTIPDFFNDICSFEEKKAINGFFMSADNANKIISQCKSFAEQEHNFLIDDFPKRLKQAGIKDDNNIEKYVSKNKYAINQYLVPSYSRLAQKLTTLSTSFNNSEVSMHICDYINGKNYYSYLARQYTGSTKSVHQMEKMIKNKLEDDVRVLLKLNDNPIIAEEIQRIDSRKINVEEIVESQITDCRKDFANPASLNYTIKNVPKSMEKYLSPAFYIVPPIDLNEKNIIYVNQAATNGFIDTYATLAHEGFPGHLYQCTYFSARNPPLIQHLLDFGGYTEGWATYCELYCYKYLFNSRDTADYMTANASYSLAIHALSDIGVNYHGWSKKHLLSVLTRYGMSDSVAVNSIYNLVTESPANYLKYYVGYLEILSLKEKFRQHYKTRYTDKKFHTFLVECGPAPFCVLEDFI
ncbi:MAG: DUF885 domain-containing protein [Lachnospiraceae bacterium]|nr:DUF885 domain-containing protein [Lachnospiraceae bacterium]